jgi:adenine-specific DNA-methyltransferase
MPHYTKPFPMPEISNEIARNLEKLVDDILASKAKNKNANTTELEEKINKIVYDLYNLTSEEIELVRKC